MEHFPKFPHLENLRNVNLGILQEKELRITEKIDGFNFRFGVTVDGLFWAGSRNQVVFPANENDLEAEPKPELLQGAVAWAWTQRHLVPKGLSLFGEWAGRGIQGRIDYGDPHFWFFDACDVRRWWVEMDELDFLADTMHLTTPHVYYDGEFQSVEHLDEILEGPHNRPVIEGIVLRGHTQMTDRFREALIVKYKNPAFEETKRRRKEPLERTTGPADDFVQDYVTEERMRHVLVLVEEQTGSNPLLIQNTGAVLRAMYEDIVREGAADYASLSEEDQKLVGKLHIPLTKNALEAARKVPWHE